MFCFFFSSRRRHTRWPRDWSSDVCSSDLNRGAAVGELATHWSPPGVPGFAQAGGPAGPDVDFLASPGGNIGLARSYLRRAGYATGRISGLPVLELVARRQASGVAFAAATREALAALGL